jgi:Mor family transcriptional regulator
MADFDKIKRNLQRMLDQNATESELDEYVASEGVTADQVRAYKPGSAQRINEQGRLEIDVVPKPGSTSGKTDGAIDGADRAARRATSALTLGLGNYLGDALTAGKNVITGQAESFPEEYSRQRKLTHEAVKPSLSPADLAADTAGYTAQAVMTAPLAAARTAGELSKGGLEALQSVTARMLAPAGQKVPAQAGLGATTLPDLAVPQTEQLTAKQVARIAAEKSDEAAAALEQKLIRQNAHRESGRIGALYGYEGGYSQVPEGTGVMDTVAEQLKHGAGGYAFGRALPVGIELAGKGWSAKYGPGGIWNSMRERIGTRARGLADEVAEAGLDPSKVPSYEYAGPAAKTAADHIGESISGSSIRGKSADWVQHLEETIARELAETGESATLAQAGARVQDFLRAKFGKGKLNSTGEEPPTLGKDAIDQMTPQQLHDQGGVPPGPHVEATPSRLDPVRPDATPRITPEEYLDRVVGQVPQVEPRPVAKLDYKEPTLDDIPLTPQFAEAQRKAMSEAQNAITAFEQAEKAYKEAEGPFKDILGRAFGPDYVLRWEPKGSPYPHYTINKVDLQTGDVLAVKTRLDFKGTPLPLQPALAPQEKEAIRRVIPYMEAEPRLRAEVEVARRKASDLIDKSETLVRAHEEYRAKVELPRLAEQRRAEALKKAEDEAKAEAKRLTQAAQQKARDEAQIDAINKADEETKELAAKAADRARLETELRQKQHEKDFAEDLEQRKHAEPVPLGKGGASNYEDELNARYTQLKKNQAVVQANILGRKASDTHPGEPSEVANLLDRIMIEARGTMQARGYKDGDLFDDTGKLRQEVIDYLRPRLGDEITNVLQSSGEYRAKGWVTPGTQGKYDTRTDIGQRVREAKERLEPGQRSTFDGAMLKRLYEAWDNQLRIQQEGAGLRGRIGLQQRDETSKAWAQFEHDIKEPLRRVFGDNVIPGDAMKYLINATQRGRGENAEALSAFYRVISDKGSNAERAEMTGYLIRHMFEGNTPHERVTNFIKTYDNLSADAKNIMFDGVNRDMGLSLDRLVNVARKTERSISLGDSSEGNLKRLSHVYNVIGAASVFSGMPIAIKVALGAEGAARLMLSAKWYGGWLRAMPVEKGPFSPEWARHVNRLRGMAAETLGLDEATADRLYDTVMKLAPTPAKAEEGEAPQAEKAPLPGMMKLGGPKPAEDQADAFVNPEGALEINVNPKREAPQDSSGTEVAGEAPEPMYVGAPKPRASGKYLEVTGIDRVMGLPNELELLKFRLGQMNRDKAQSKKLGRDVESPAYAHYNVARTQLRERIKELEAGKKAGSDDFKRLSMSGIPLKMSAEDEEESLVQLAAIRGAALKAPPQVRVPRNPEGVSLSKNFSPEPEDSFTYGIYNNGKEVGYVTGTVTDNVAYIDAMYAAKDAGIGVKGLKQLREDIRQDFPKINTFEGHRVPPDVDPRGAAREKSGWREGRKGDEEPNFQSVRLKAGGAPLPDESVDELANPRKRLPGEAATPPQQPLRGARSEIANDDPGEMKEWAEDVIKSIGGDAKKGMVLKDMGRDKTPGVLPWESFKRASSEEGGYKPGQGDFEAIEEIMDIAGAASVGSLAGSRPTGAAAGMGAARRFSPEEKAQVISMAEAGKSLNAIERHTKIRRESIKKILKGEEIAEPANAAAVARNERNKAIKDDYAAQELTISQIAKKYDLTDDAIVKITRGMERNRKTGPRLKLTAEQEAEIAKRLAAGEDTRRLALEYDLNPVTIREDVLRRQGAADVYQKRKEAFYEKLKQLRSEGKSHADIARELKIHENTVYRVGREKLGEVSERVARRRAEDEGTEFVSQRHRTAPVGRGLNRGKTAADRAAISDELRIREMEDSFKARGMSDDQIAQAINRREGTNITGQDIKQGNVWWRVGEAAEELISPTGRGRFVSGDETRNESGQGSLFDKHAARLADETDERSFFDKFLDSDDYDDLDARGLPLPKGEKKDETPTDYTGIQSLMYDPAPIEDKLKQIQKVAPDLVGALRAFHARKQHYYPELAKKPASLAEAMELPADAPEDLRKAAEPLEAELWMRLIDAPDHKGNGISKLGGPKAMRALAPAKKDKTFWQEYEKHPGKTGKDDIEVPADKYRSEPGDEDMVWEPDAIDAYGEQAKQPGYKERTHHSYSQPRNKKGRFSGPPKNSLTH